MKTRFMFKAMSLFSLSKISLHLVGPLLKRNLGIMYFTAASKKPFRKILFYWGISSSQCIQQVKLIN